MDQDGALCIVILESGCIGFPFLHPKTFNRSIKLPYQLSIGLNLRAATALEATLWRVLQKSIML